MGGGDFSGVWNPYIFVIQGLMQSFITLEQLFQIPPGPPCLPKNNIVWGKGGSRIFLRCGILIFLLHRALCKVSEPEDNFLTLCTFLYTFCTHIFGIRSQKKIFLYFLYTKPPFLKTITKTNIHN